MLDRLSLSLVTLPPTTYDLIMILMDEDNTRAESKKLLNVDLLSRIVKSLKPGGRIQSQNGKFGIEDEEERRQAIFAGLMIEGDDLVKPNQEATQSVPLRFGKKKNEGGVAAVNSAAGTGAVTLNLNGKRKNGPPDSTQPAGVGFVDFSDDFSAPEVDDDDELIDEDTLLDEEDLKRPVVQRKFSCAVVELAGGVANQIFYLSPRMPSQDWETSSSLQRLHLWTGPTTGGRG